jgi:hypothetical protein
MTRLLNGHEEAVFAYLYEGDGTPPVYEGERGEWFTPEDAGHMAMAFGAEILFAPDVVAQAKAALSLE